MRLIAIVVLLAATYAAPIPAFAAGVPVVDVIGNSLLIKESVIQAKQFAQEIKGYADIANTYLTAAQNTARIPLSALQAAQSVYYRVSALGNSVSAITGPNSTMMGRLRATQYAASSAGSLPGGVGSTYEYWRDQTQRQFDDNAALLGLEEERRSINDELVRLAAANGDSATGQMQALQANNQATIAVAQQMQQLNAQQQRDFMYQLNKDAQANAIQADRQRFLNDKPIPQKAWLQ